MSPPQCDYVFVIEFPTQVTLFIFVSSSAYIILLSFVMFPSPRSTRSSKKKRRRSPRKASSKPSNCSSKSSVCCGCNISFSDNKSLLYHKKRSDHPKCQSDLIRCDVCGVFVLNEFGLAVHQRSDVHCMNRQVAIEEASVVMRHSGGPLSNNQHLNVTQDEQNEFLGLSDVYGASDNEDKSMKKKTKCSNSNYSSSDEYDYFHLEQEASANKRRSHIAQPHQRHLDSSVFDFPPPKNTTVVDSEMARKRLEKVTLGLAKSLPRNFISAHVFHNHCVKRNTMLRIDLDKIESQSNISRLESAIVKVFRLTDFKSSRKSGNIEMFIRQFYDNVCDCPEVRELSHRINDMHLYGFLETNGIIITESEVPTQDRMNVNEDEQEEDDERELANAFDVDDESISDEDDINQTNDVDVVVSSVEKRMLSWQKEVNDVQTNAIFDKSDVANIELFELLRTSGAPKYLFERIQQWSANHSSALSSSNPVSRKTFVNRMRTKTYGPNFSKHLEPKVHDLILQHGSRIPVVYFSFRAVLASLLSNKGLMKDENLLLNPNNPFDSITDGMVLSDLNSGWWHRETCKMFRLQPQKDILLPIVLFIDGSTIDSNQKMSVEPITFTLGIFNRSVRSKAEAWRTIGYIEKLKHVLSEPIVRRANNSRNKLQDKHSIIKFILRELIELQGPDSGFKWDLEIGGNVHRVNFKIAVQVIIGDCKGNDELCGRYGNHSKKTSGFCRDCKVDYDTSDDPYEKCRWISPMDFVEKTEDDLNRMGFHDIENAFSLLNFGAGNRGVYGATPSEPLHSYKLGICKYIFDGFVSHHLPKKTLKKMDKMLTALGSGSQRQSYQPFPKICVVRDGITKIGTVTADEQFARIFCVYLSLNNPIIFESLSNDNRYAKPKNRDENDDDNNLAPVSIGAMGIEDATKWFHLLEDTVLYHSWLYAEEHDLNDLIAESNDDSDGSVSNLSESSEIDEGHKNRSDNDLNGDDSVSMHYIRKYLDDLKNVLKRSEGNQHKLVKFHQQLHNPRQVLKDGVLLNVDGGRCESIAIFSSKNQASISQKRAVKLNWQIANNLFDDTSIKDTSILQKRILESDLYQNKRCTQRCDDVSVLGGSQFSIFIDDPEVATNDTGPILIKMKWQSTRTYCQINEEVSKALVQRLYFNTSLGGCLKNDCVIKGYTELKVEGYTYRSHPSYWGEKPWYDWALVQWEHDSDPYPAQICMFLDLTEASFMTIAEHNEFKNSPLGRKLIQEANFNPLPGENNYDYLTKSFWMVVRSSLSCDEQGVRVRDEYRVTSRICKRYYMEDEYRIVPVDAIEGPAFCLHVEGTVDCSNTVSGNDQIISLKPKKEWNSLFLKKN